MSTHDHSGHMGHDTAAGSTAAGSTMTEPEAVHRWIVFGRNNIYLSHLSMFSMTEHAIQLLVAAEFADAEGNPSDAYSEDRRAHPDQRLYTLDPQLFVLGDLLSAPTRTHLTADLYRNHVEQPPTGPAQIGSGLDVAIRRIVYAHRYAADPEPLTELEYLLFGTSSELFLAHFITRPPDFDQIIAVSLDVDLSDDELVSGLRLSIPDRANTLKARLTEGTAAIPATLHRADGTVTVQVTPSIEYYVNADQDLQ